MVIALSYDERRTGKGLPCMGRLPGIAGENHWTSVRIKVAGLLHHFGRLGGGPWPGFSAAAGWHRGEANGTET